MRVTRGCIRRFTRIPLCAAIVVCFVLIAAEVSAQHDDQATFDHEHLVAAQTLFKSGKYDEVRALLLPFATSPNPDATPLYLLALVELQLHDAARADEL